MTETKIKHKVKHVSIIPYNKRMLKIIKNMLPEDKSQGFHFYYWIPMQFKKKKGFRQVKVHFLYDPENESNLTLKKFGILIRYSKNEIKIIESLIESMDRFYVLTIQAPCFLGGQYLRTEILHFIFCYGGWDDRVWIREPKEKPYYYMGCIELDDNQIS